MPYFLESGKLRLTPDEAITYRAAADRLHDACGMAVDVTQPISVEDWVLLRVAHAAIGGDLGPLESVISAIEASIRRRR